MVYAMVIRRDSVSAVAYFNIGNVYFLVGDVVSVCVSYFVVFDCELNYFKVLYNFVIVIDFIGFVGEVKEWMKRVVDCRSNDLCVMYVFVLLYVKFG